MFSTSSKHTRQAALPLPAGCAVRVGGREARRVACLAHSHSLVRARSLSLWLHVGVCVYVCVYILDMWVSVCGCMYVCMYVCMCTYVYMYIYIRTYTYIYFHIYIHEYAYM